jgi:hypothetical protein
MHSRCIIALMTLRPFVLWIALLDVTTTSWRCWSFRSASEARPVEVVIKHIISSDPVPLNATIAYDFTIHEASHSHAIQIKHSISHH